MSTTSARTDVAAGFDMFRNAGENLDGVIRRAREAGKRILPIGSGWALSKINITDGWLVNTKLLNGCYDVGDRYFEAAYPDAGRPGVVGGQAGMQIAELNAYLELIPEDDSKRRALKAAGIGNGQTIAGAVSGTLAVAERISRVDAALEQHRALQADLDAELLVAGQVHLGDQHLDDDLRRLGVQLARSAA